jgi:hypothetical protein
MDGVQFQSSQVHRVPELSGLYAWHYKPLVIESQNLSQTISSFFDSPGAITNEIGLRYGMYMISESKLSIVYGSQQQSIAEVVHFAATNADQFLIDFFKSELAQVFTRPVYVGIARNLHKRINQHYNLLQDMWDDNSPVSRYMSAKPDSSVQEIMDKLSLQHSFSLEARVKKIPTRDLAVNIFTTNKLPSDIGSDDGTQDESVARRSLERLLQLIADPICGRR